MTILMLIQIQIHNEFILPATAVTVSMSITISGIVVITETLTRT